MLYLFLADGFEETEAIAPLDILRRAEIPVRTAGVTGRTVTGAHGIAVQAELSAAEAAAEDCGGVILPGGMPGTVNLRQSREVAALLRHCFENQKLIAAICAAPSIPGELGMLKGRRATCYPGFENSLHGAVLSQDGVVRDGNFITAKGAGAALEFGAALTDYFRPGTGAEILAQMQTAGYGA